MISQTAVVLAVTLTLLLCLLVLLATCTIFLLRFRHQNTNDRIDIERLHDERAKLKKQLAASPKGWDGKNTDSLFSRTEVIKSFNGFVYVLNSYVGEWIDDDKASSPSRNESAARIELLLFPEPPPEHFLTTGKDTRRFPNPHEYTPAEICALLEQNHSREYISHHIISSILLKGISIEGNPLQTLLPLNPSEVYALDKLRTSIRGVELFTAVPAYISKFGVYCTEASRQKHPQEVAERAQCIKLFESLFGPYFKTKSPADVTQRRLEFNAVLDAAIQLGMTLVGTSERIEFRWGTRNHIAIALEPPLHALEYNGEELTYDTEISKGMLAGLWNSQE